MAKAKSLGDWSPSGIIQGLRYCWLLCLAPLLDLVTPPVHKHDFLTFPCSWPALLVLVVLVPFVRGQL